MQVALSWSGSKIEVGSIVTKWAYSLGISTEETEGGCGDLRGSRAGGIEERRRSAPQLYPMNTNLSAIERQEAEYQRLYSTNFNEHIHLANRMAVTIQLTNFRSTTTWIFQGKKTHIDEKIRQASTFMYLLQQDEGKLLILCPLCQNHCSRRLRIINTWVSLIGGGVEEGKNSRCVFDDHDQGQRLQKPGKVREIWN